MSQSGSADYGSDLKEFSCRLEAKIREFKVWGEFSDAHEAFANEIRQRQAELSRKVDEVIQNGTTWDVIKAEFTRDYNSICDNFLRWENRLDAEAMKRTIG